MRKWLIGALLAATVGLPVAAQAQQARMGREDGSAAARTERRAQRQERRAERQEQRVERQPRAERQEQRAERRGQPRVEVAQPTPQIERRAERQGQQAEGLGRQSDGVVRLDRRNPSYDPARGDRPDRLNPRRDDLAGLPQVDRERLAAVRRAQQGRDNRADLREDWRDARVDRRDESRQDNARFDWNRSNDWNNRNNRWNPNYGSGNGNWNRDWRQDGRYDWNGYRSGNRNAFRLPRYYAPYGWDRGYRRFSIGVSLSSVLWGRNYWIDEPGYYRLPEAYGPYRWVRYYNDALLVDIETGEVVDTVYDIFY